MRHEDRRTRPFDPRALCGVAQPLEAGGVNQEFMLEAREVAAFIEILLAVHGARRGD